MWAAGGVGLQSLILEGLRQEDHLSPRVPVQSGQHSETSSSKNNKAVFKTEIALAPQTYSKHHFFSIKLFRAEILISYVMV